jgi:hypothetical protein
MMWVGIGLVPWALLQNTSDAKFNSLLIFLFLLYVFRGFIDKGALERLARIWKNNG